MNIHNELGDSDDIAISHLLEDWLNEVEPADFKSKILHRVEESGAENPDHLAALAFAEQQMSQGYGIVIPPPVVLESSIDEKLGVWIQRGATVVSVLAACVLAVLLVPAALRWGNEPTKQLGKELPGTGTGLTGKEDVAPEPHKQESIATSEEKDPLAKRQLPSIASNPPSEKENENEHNEGALANDSNSTKIAVSTPEKSSPSQGAESLPTTTPKKQRLVGAMADREVVGVVDNQLKHLWGTVGVAPEPSIKSELWLDRASLAVVGRMPTASEREMVRTNKSEDKQIDFVNRLIDSEEFARYWSTILAEHYLGRPITSSRLEESDEYAFVQWIESSLLQKKSIGDIESELVARPAEGSRSPASFWLAETIESSQRIHRESARHLASPGKAIDAKEAGLIGIAQQLMRISGNTAMACSQCHGDSFLGSADLARDAKSQLRSSDLFWRVPANFAGVSIEYKDKQRLLNAIGRSEFFFEDTEGRLQLAQPGPPSTMAANQSNSLVDWLRTSPEPRRAMVELAWNKMLLQPLVPVFGLSETEGQVDRKDLRDLLALQLQRGGGELGSLVRWIVLSRPFQLDRISTEAPWYLKATEPQLAIKQNQLRLFSGFTANQVSLSSEKPSIDTMATWVDSSGSFQRSESALAQGNGKPSTAVLPLNKSSRTEYSEEQIRYLMSVSKPYEQLDALASQWSTSSMDWASQVDHTFLVASVRFPTRKEREDADRFLEAANSDHQKAIVMLMNSKLGSW